MMRFVILLSLLQLHLISPKRMSDALAYSVNIKFWKIRKTGDNDLLVGLCDKSSCVGFQYFDQGGYCPIQWPTANILCDQGPTTGSSDWGNVVEQVWETKYEILPRHTWAATMSPVFNKATARRFSVSLKPSGGLWLTVCRHDATEEHYIRYFEISVMQN